MKLIVFDSYQMRENPLNLDYESLRRDILCALKWIKNQATSTLLASNRYPDEITNNFQRVGWSVIQLQNTHEF